VDLAIVIFHPNNTDYQIFHLDILDKEIQDMLDCRMRSVQQGSKNPVEFPDTPCELEDD
jgi:hypothetical protein